MSSGLQVTFVVAVNNREVLTKNLLSSACLQVPHRHQLIIQEGFTSAAMAYNDALSGAVNEIVILVHQDVFLPESWLPELSISLQYLAENDPGWGVLGCWGINQSGEGFGHVYTPGQGVIGHAFHNPVRVQTLDELILVMRKSSGLRFDQGLPSFHLYGTDICMAAASAGMNCYAISAFCLHNSQQYFKLPFEFVCCYRHVKRVWRNFLPIHTSCITISRMDGNFYGNRIRMAFRRMMNGNQERGSRADDLRLISLELKDKSRLGPIQ